jgi:hypothetical protein
LQGAEALTAQVAPRRRTFGWVATFAAGFLAGFAPFLELVQAFPGLDELMRLIPQGREVLLGPLTGVLTGLLTLGLRYRDLVGTAALRKLFRRAAGGLPAGLALLLAFQLRFVVRQPLDTGERMVSVIVAPPRTKECLCAPRLTDAECVRISSDPAAIARCWGYRAVRTNEALWSFAYLLAVAGLCSSIGFLRLRGVAPARGLGTGPPLSSAAPERRLFLSYSSQDGEFVERLERDLGDHGIAVWRDQGELAAGDSLPDKLANAIAGSLWFGIILSPDAVASRWVQLELATAIALEIKTGAVTVLPILCRPCEIPAVLLGKKHADFNASYNDGLATLLRALKKQSAEGPTPGKSDS